MKLKLLFLTMILATSFPTFGATAATLASETEVQHFQAAEILGQISLDRKARRQGYLKNKIASLKLMNPHDRFFKKCYRQFLTQDIDSILEIMGKFVDDVRTILIDKITEEAKAQGITTIPLKKDSHNTLKRCEPHLSEYFHVSGGTDEQQEHLKQKLLEAREYTWKRSNVSRTNGRNWCSSRR